MKNEKLIQQARIVAANLGITQNELAEIIGEKYDTYHALQDCADALAAVLKEGEE